MANTFMNKRYAVLDTNALISYFDSVFKQASRISDEALKLIRHAFQSDSDVVLSIPSVVFIEIYDKWVLGDEFRAMFVSEVLELILQAPNIEIKPIDEEVLENFMYLDDPEVNLENHDRIILASAMMLQWPLITSDSKILKYAKRHRVIPSVIQ